MNVTVREIEGTLAHGSANGSPVSWHEQRPVALRVVGAEAPWTDVVEQARQLNVAMLETGRGVVLSGTVVTCRELADVLQRLHPELAPRIQAALSIKPPVRLLGRGRALPLGERTLVMGIINLSPDSFSGDGLTDPAAAIEQARRFIDEGADILDVGAMSTRPHSQSIPEELEAARLENTIRLLRPLTTRPISADTYRLAPAQAALEAGADIVNDVSGLRDRRVAELIARYGAGAVVMHMLGTPQTMQLNPTYTEVVDDVYAYLDQAVERAEAAGIEREAIIVDPGIGFGKTLEHNLELLRRLREFTGLGCALLVGTSRKGFVGRITQTEGPERVEGTAATIALAIANGADIVRVHDVRHMAAVARMSDAVVRPTRSLSASEAVGM